MATKLLRRGFSWTGLFFVWTWLFIKRLWKYAFISLALYFFLVYLIDNIFGNKGSEGALLGLSIGMGMLVAQNGNAWRRKTLVKRGCQHISAVEATTPDAAIASVASPPPVAVSSQSQDFDKQLRRLAGLKEEGIISSEEFDQKKKLLLGLL